MKSWKRKSLGLTAAFLGVAGLAVSPAVPASAAHIGHAATGASVANTALILGDSVSPGVAPDGSGKSLEEYEANLDGFATTVVTGAQWDAMTASEFAQYQELIIGDPTCDPTGASFAAAVANESTWEPVVMASGGNKVLIGTDPTYHYVVNGVPGDKLEAGGIAFAGAVAGATGAYVDLSCGYDSTDAGTPVPLLDGLSTHGPSQFTVIGEGSIGACATGVNIVANSGPTSGLTDAQLSNWQCSVHEAFDSFPSDYTPLALAPTSSGFPNSYCANDVETGSLACGSPYIMVSGGGVVVTSNVTLNPASQNLAQGGSATLVANVTTKKGSKVSPVAGASVVFNVDSGPNVGTTFTGTTDSSGNTTFGYADTGGAGTDAISATYTDSHGVSQKATATVTWVTSTTHDHAPPVCVLLKVKNGPPESLTVDIEDNRSGIATISVVSATNATVKVPTFTAGTNGRNLVRLFKTDQTIGSAVHLSATDVAGNTHDCSFVFFVVNGKTKQSMTGVDPVDSTIDVVNYSLPNLSYSVDGAHEFVTLTPNQNKFIQAGRLFTQPSDNGVTVVGHCTGLADVVFFDGSLPGNPKRSLPQKAPRVVPDWCAG